jgi:mRNA-degrading endonuclease toxin of MazEF toxin-antitoxin module
MCEQIRAITTDRLEKHIGKMDHNCMKALEDRIKNALDFN